MLAYYRFNYLFADTIAYPLIYTLASASANYFHLLQSKISFYNEKMIKISQNEHFKMVNNFPDGAIIHKNANIEDSGLSIEFSQMADRS